MKQFGIGMQQEITPPIFGGSNTKLHCLHFSRLRTITSSHWMGKTNAIERLELSSPPKKYTSARLSVPEVEVCVVRVEEVRVEELRLPE